MWHDSVNVAPMITDGTCTIGNKAKSPEAILIGDSHAYSDIDMVDVFLKDA